MPALEIYYLVFLKSIAPGPKTKAGGKNIALGSTGKYVRYVLKVGTEVDHTGAQY